MAETQKEWVAVKKEGKEGQFDPTIMENEIRVTAQGRMRNYVTYAATLLTEKQEKVIVLKGMGRVISKAVSLAEILKRRVKGLYQLTEIGSVKVTDINTTKKEGDAGGEDETTEITRLLSVIKISLTTIPTEDKRYQAPLPEDMIEPLKALPVRKPQYRKNTAKKIAPEKKQNGVTAKVVSDAVPETEVKSEEVAVNNVKSRARPRKPNKAKAQKAKTNSVVKTEKIAAATEEPAVKVEETPVVVVEQEE